MLSMSKTKGLIGCDREPDQSLSILGLLECLGRLVAFQLERALLSAGEEDLAMEDSLDVSVEDGRDATLVDLSIVLVVVHLVVRLDSATRGELSAVGVGDADAREEGDGHLLANHRPQQLQLATPLAIAHHRVQSMDGRRVEAAVAVGQLQALAGERALAQKRARQHLPLGGASLEIETECSDVETLEQLVHFAVKAAESRQHHREMVDARVSRDFPDDVRRVRTLLVEDHVLVVGTPALRGRQRRGDGLLLDDESVHVVVGLGLDAVQPLVHSGRPESVGDRQSFDDVRDEFIGQLEEGRQEVSVVYVNPSGLYRESTENHLNHLHDDGLRGEVDARIDEHFLLSSSWSLLD
ncbi:hypothetical protein PMAYCL1PPCAC_26362, partial [Pristionchus mayeri]